MGAPPDVARLLKDQGPAHGVRYSIPHGVVWASEPAPAPPAPADGSTGPLVARGLSLLGQEQLLPLFEEQQIDDESLVMLEPGDLMSLGIPAEFAIEILIAAGSAEDLGRQA